MPLFHLDLKHYSGHCGFRRHSISGIRCNVSLRCRRIHHWPSLHKSSANTGTHVGHLWSTNGTLLGSATFTGGDCFGLATGDFPSAIAVTAGTTYIASYFAPNGHYSRNGGYFASAGVDNGPLHLLRDGVDGGNGVFDYSTTTTFPTSTFQCTNYWVDVVFNTTPGNPSGPTVLSTSLLAQGASGISPSTSVSAVFSQDMNAATITTTTFRLLDSSNNPISASVTYNASTRTATLTPSSALNAASVYKAVITGGSNGIKNTVGTPMSSDASWLFTTAQPVNCPCSIWTSSATPSIVTSTDVAAVEWVSDSVPMWMVTSLVFVFIRAQLTPAPM